MRKLLIGLWVLAACQPATIDFSNGTWIDLSYSFDEQTIYWPTDTMGFGWVKN